MAASILVGQYSKISSKKYGKAAEITLKGDDKAPINISWQS